jgi:hypothetical protein
MLSATVTLSACAGWPLLTESTTDHLDFFARALSADPQKRESMWRDASRASRSQGAALDRALLQSVPGHSGYDPNAAESAFQALIDDGPPAAVDSVARMRLAQLRAESRAVAECRQENAQLKQRLTRVVDIERKLNSNGH